MPWPFGGGRWFPGTNLQDLNLDWIIRRVRDLSKGIIAPWINTENYHWMVYDVEQEKFVDSGVSASGEGVGPPGPGVPTGGAVNDILVKTGTADYATGFTSTPAQMGSIAYVEQTSTVSKQGGYQPGDYLVYNGRLYKVGSAAISQGQTLTPGGNISAITVMDAKADKSALDSKADKSATIPAVRFFDSSDTTQRSIHIPNGARFVFLCATANMNFVGAWLSVSFSSGLVQQPAAMYAPSDVSFDVSVSNTLTINTTQARQLEMCILLINNSNTSDYYII